MIGVLEDILKYNQPRSMEKPVNMPFLYDYRLYMPDNVSSYMAINDGR